MLLLQSLLSQDYFDGLVVADRNPFAPRGSFDTVQPLVTQTYADTAVAQPAGEPDPEPSEGLAPACPAPRKAPVSGKWRPAFPRGFLELSFSSEPAACSFEVVRVVAAQSDMTLSPRDIKESLSGLYHRLAKTHPASLFKIMTSEGKAKIARKLRRTKERTHVRDIIESEDYQCTGLDIWLLADHYQLPIALFSATKLPGTDTDLVVRSATTTASLFFIKVSGSAPGTPPRFKLVVSPQGGSQIAVATLSSTLQGAGARLAGVPVGIPAWSEQRHRPSQTEAPHASYGCPGPGSGSGSVLVATWSKTASRRSWKLWSVASVAAGGASSSVASRASG